MLVEHLAEAHGAVLRTLTYVPTFKDLLIKNEQNKVRSPLCCEIAISLLFCVYLAD